MKITSNELFILASNSFLCEELPDNYDEMEENELIEFVGENIWQPLENHSAEEVISMIDSSARTMIEFLEAKGIEIIEGENK
jgi:hypothetical protein